MRNDRQPAPNQRVCRACGRTFPVQGRKAYCDDACRQRGFRLRQRPSDEIGLGLATRLPKTAIVYQCPECEARCLGQQRCDDCGVFMKRLGPGGACPHCDEAVAVADLIAEDQASTSTMRLLPSDREVITRPHANRH